MKRIKLTKTVISALPDVVSAHGDEDYEEVCVEVSAVLDMK